MPPGDPAAKSLTAADVMTANPRNCSPFSSVTEATLIFRDADCGAVPVLQDGKPVGILTDRDVALALAEHPDLANLAVSDIMTQGVVTISAEAPMEEVRRKFAEAQVRRLLVVNGSDQLLGILSWSDLVDPFPKGEVIESPENAGGDSAALGDEASGRLDGDREGKPTPDRGSILSPKAFWELLRQAGQEWLEDKAPRLGAALAYYTIFSLAPLLLLAIAVAGLVFHNKKEAAQGQIVHQLENMLGQNGAEAIEAMIASASDPKSGYKATGIGIALLLVGAMGLFGQLQDAMNTVWGVQPKPGRGLLGLLKDRLLSLSMVMGTVFLLLVSLIASSALAAMGGLLGEWGISRMGQVIEFAVSFAVITGLFAMIFRFLPDAKVAWRDVWPGAVVTALLFAIGKTAIGLYIGRSGVKSSYGAAGSLVVLLIWAYYSSQIFLFGAEMTQAYADRYGSKIEPEKDAEFMTAEARARQGIPRRSEARIAGGRGKSSG